MPAHSCTCLPQQVDTSSSAAPLPDIPPPQSHRPATATHSLRKALTMECAVLHWSGCPATSSTRPPSSVSCSQRGGVGQDEDRTGGSSGGTASLRRGCAHYHNSTLCCSRGSGVHACICSAAAYQTGLQAAREWRVGENAHDGVGTAGHGVGHPARPGTAQHTPAGGLTPCSCTRAPLICRI